MTPEIDSIRGQIAAGGPVCLGPYEQCHCTIDGTPVTFNLDREHDPIQRNNRAGRFYEHKELHYLRDAFPPGGTFVDIGANIGNHSLFFALFAKASRVIPIEPNPVSYRLLIANVLCNRLLDIVDLSRLGVGVSDTKGTGFAIEDRARNIGAARLVPGAGTITALPGDALFQGETPNLIKIDVEGMELLALKGLSETIARCRPRLFVEVDDLNVAGFHQWCRDSDYAIERVWQRYKTNKNMLVRSKTA